MGQIGDMHMTDDMGATERVLYRGDGGGKFQLWTADWTVRGEVYFPG